MAMALQPVKGTAAQGVAPGALALDPAPAVSVVVPVHNEAENIERLVEEIRAALDGYADYEVVYVNDGSDDETAERLRAVRRTFPRLRILHHDRRCGQSAALWTGVRAARGRWIATLDGDGQNDPADIPRLLEIARAEGGPALVCGYRGERRAGWVTRISSRIANAVRGALLRDRTPDTGCGLKVFRREVFLELPFFDHMHRFLPALVMRNGGRVVSVPVRDRPRTRGRSHYGVWNRLWIGLVDLTGVLWLQRRAAKPAGIREEGSDDEC